jgi:hypothetical protein
LILFYFLNGPGIGLGPYCGNAGALGQLIFGFGGNGTRTVLAIKYPYFFGVGCGPDPLTDG